MKRPNRVLTHEQFLEKLWNKNEHYRNGDFEVIGKYEGHRFFIKTKTEFGLCSIKANSLLTGNKPHIRSAVNKTEYAINILKEVHGDTYDYSKFKYVTAKTLSTIICKDHGEFEQTYDVHKKGHGCTKCYNERSTKTTKEFVKEASKKHNNEFDYSKSIYVKGTEKIEIICRTHGSFWQTPNSHVSDGQKCPYCYRELKGWTKTHFVDFCNIKEKQARFYVIYVYNEEEFFYKIGITSNTLKRRFRPYDMPYNYEVIHLIKDSASIVWDLEQKNKKILREYQYIPKIKFDGMYECYGKIEDLETKL